MHLKPLTIYRMWLERVSAEPDVTQKAIANELNIDYSTYVSRWHQGLLEHSQTEPAPGIQGEPEVTEGDAIIVGDVHVPYVDYGLASLVSQMGKKYLRKPRRLIIAGDLFNQDAFSSYAAVIRPPRWAEERDSARGLIAEWLKTFDNILFTMGNHDRRLQKWVNGEFEDTDILAMVNSSDKVRSSNFGYSILRSGSQVYRVTHPAAYSINPLVVLSDLAQKYQQNVIGFHEHHLTKGWDRYGRYVIINGGILADAKKFAYSEIDDNKKPVHKQGFVMVRNGVADVFGREPFTDWGRWL